MEASIPIKAPLAKDVAHRPCMKSHYSSHSASRMGTRKQHSFHRQTGQLLRFNNKQCFAFRAGSFKGTGCYTTKRQNHEAFNLPQDPTKHEGENISNKPRLGHDHTPWCQRTHEQEKATPG